MSDELLRRLDDTNLVALRIPGSQWPRGLLAERAVPDGWQAVVIAPDGRRRLVPAGQEPDCGKDDWLLLVRSEPVTIELTFDDLPTTDRHVGRALCRLQLRWPPRADDLAALARESSGEPLTTARLVELLKAQGAAAALREFVRQRGAAELIEADPSRALEERLREALKAWLFANGAELAGLVAWQFHSPTWQQQQHIEQRTRQRIEQIKAREMVEQAALAATRRRLDDLGDLLEKLHQAADEGDSRWHELLPALSPDQRGRLLQNLWRITPDRIVARAIVAICGDEVLWLDPLEPENVRQRVNLTADLGHLRSVAYDRAGDRLLVGAAAGLWLLDADSGQMMGCYRAAAGETPTTGFNAAVVIGEWLYATSSQLGCWGWPLGDPGQPRPILVPESGVPRRVRAATALPDGRLLFAADDCLHVWDAQDGELATLASADDVIQVAAVLDDVLYVATVAGRLYRVELSQPEDWWLVYQSSGPLEAVQPRRWMDLVELVVPAGPQGVCGIYGEENVVTTLMPTATPARRAWACDDVIVALNHLRDRLTVTNANLPERASREVRLARMTGHSIQDACIVTQTVAANGA